jgi:hypothetical protein
MEKSFDEFMEDFLEEKPKPTPEEVEKSWIEWASKKEEE